MAKRKQGREVGGQTDRQTSTKALQKEKMGEVQEAKDNQEKGNFLVALKYNFHS